jgi:hypothetical protein
MKKSILLLTSFIVLLLVFISFIIFNRLGEKMEKQERGEFRIKFLEDSLNNVHIKKQLDSSFPFDHSKIK